VNNGEKRGNTDKVTPTLQRRETAARSQLQTNVRAATVYGVTWGLINVVLNLVVGFGWNVGRGAIAAYVIPIQLIIDNATLVVILFRSQRGLGTRSNNDANVSPASSLGFNSLRALNSHSSSHHGVHQYTHYNSLLPSRRSSRRLTAVAAA